MRSSLNIIAVVCAIATGAAAGQERTGPRPEVRAHIEAFTGALNSGSADQWEQMAKERFSERFLASRDAAARRRLFAGLRKEFGTITVGRVTRDGPDAPLRLDVKGSTGAAGTIELVLEGDPPFKIGGVGVNVGGPGEDPGNVPAPPIGPGMSQEELSRGLDGYLRKLTEDEVFSGVVLVAKNGTPLFEKGYGFADRANRLPNTSATRFNLGSINKIFTQTAIEQLIARGKLERTDTIGERLPAYPQAETRAATIEQLLQHMGGISDFFNEEFERMAKDRFRSNADYYRFVSSRPPLFAPGARSQYCNGCYITLGEIVASVSGMPYEQYIEQNIYQPAGMTASGPLQADALQAQVAMGYTRRGGPLRSNIYTRGASGSAAGGGYATAADLLAFDRAMKHGTLLPSERAAAFYAGRGIAGGSSGVNAVLESGQVWTVIVLTNLDPPAGESIGVAIARALNR
jgi:CubicO group peptidase (beta-lactamase class C family)